MTALRAVPSDFGYAPAREARRASDQALLGGLTTGCMLLGLAYAALLAVGPYLPRTIELSPPPPHSPPGTIENFQFEQAVPPAGPIHPSAQPTHGVPVPVPEAPEVPATVVQQGSGVPGPAVEEGGGGAGPAVSEVAPPHTLEPGEYVYHEVEPALAVQVKPVYPEFAVQAQVEGTVLLWARVETDGTVGEVRVRKSVPLLDEAAVAAVRRWRFTPALASGKPVAVWVSVPVRFSLH